MTGATPQTRNYYLEAEHLEAITDENNIFTDRYFRGVVVDEIVHGYHVDSNSIETASTFHHDHLRSVTSTVDRLGAELSTSTFGPFGGLLSETGSHNGNRLRYTGRELDEEAGLYYYRARYYDPEVGRFLTEDPLGFSAGINFYAYVNNNPINANDPSGLLNPIWHAGINFVAGLKTGQGFFKSLGLAWDGLVRDWNDSSVSDKSAAVQNRHGTGGMLNVGTENERPQIRSEAHEGITQAYNNQLANGDLEGALHNSQDIAIAQHRDETFGTGNWFDNLIHGIKDLFISPSTLGKAYDNSIETIKAIQNGTTPQMDLRNGVLNPTNQVGSASGSVDGASGGFVIYPNKPNTNAMQRVYSK